MVQAQGYFVNLYDWKDESIPYTGLIDIASSNSATFIGSYGEYTEFNQLHLNGSMNTTPGEMYDISFTLQDKSSTGDDGGIGSFYFGNSETSLDGAFLDSSLTNGAYVFQPVNYNFFVVATSSTTAMSFNLVLDEGLDAQLSDFSIIETTPAPEPSSGRLVAYGGCMVLLARQLQKLFQKRKPALKPIA